jgi:hypothetical protein
MPYPLPEDVLLTTRMHLNETQVRGLMARLTLWLETGSLTPNSHLSDPSEMSTNRPLESAMEISAE